MPDVKAPEEKIDSIQQRKDTIKVDDILIFSVDEYRDGDICQFDGHVQNIRDDGVDVIYLSGYRSRNDFIPWKDVIAKVDLEKPYISLGDHAPYSGNFIVFDEVTEQNAE